MTFDSAYLALESLTDESSDGVDRNEAQTRLAVIDRVLMDVLDWPRSQISVESSVGGGFSDYELRTQHTLCIAEAKREGVSFALPLDSQAGTVSLVPLLQDRSNRSLKSALEQVMSYSSIRGVAPSIVTNGHQWVAFLASRNDGVAPLRGKALVFPSLQAVRDNFALFYNTLSLEGLKSGRIFSELSLAASAPPANLAAAINGYPGVKRRNNMQNNLQIMGEVMLEDMPQEEAYADVFLEQCYAASGALSSYAEISRELLTSRSAAMLAEIGAVEEPAVQKKGLNPALSDEALSAAASHRPIVLLGGVGSGKVLSCNI